MANSERDRVMSPTQCEWSYRPAHGVVENHLGRRLRAAYDALPAEPLSDGIRVQLRRLNEAGAREPGPAPKV